MSGYRWSNFQDREILSCFMVVSGDSLALRVPFGEICSQALQQEIMEIHSFAVCHVCMCWSRSSDNGHAQDNPLYPSTPSLFLFYLRPEPDRVGTSA
jgi:hypothetical protein